jgi:hypothetical protein
MHIVKITTGNRITIPKSLMKRFESQGRVCLIDTPKGLLLRTMDRPEEQLEKLRKQVKAMNIPRREIMLIVKHVRAHST